MATGGRISRGLTWLALAIVVCVLGFLGVASLIARQLRTSPKELLTHESRYEQEFLRLYPDAYVDSMYSTGQYGTPTTQLRAAFYRRYVLTMQVPTYRTNARPRFSLVEAGSIGQMADGRSELRYGESWTITPEQWDSLVKAGGDFSSIGIALKTNEPLPGFEEHWLEF